MDRGVKLGISNGKGSGRGFGAQELGLLGMNGVIVAVVVMAAVVVAVVVVTQLGMIRRGAVRTAVAAGFGAGTERFGHDLANGAGATAALRAAAEAAIDLPGSAGHDLVAGHNVSHVVIADNVTGTDNHGRNFGPLMTSYG